VIEEGLLNATSSFYLNYVECKLAMCFGNNVKSPFVLSELCGM